MAQESDNFGHEHPLILLNEEDNQQTKQSNQSEEEGEEAYCFRCGEEVLPSAPRFRCAECNGFYLHKLCAEAPLEINHPYHPNHPLLLQTDPYPSGGWRCDFCDKSGEKFVYHCSCGLDFHIKCALFTYNIAQRNLKELEHVAYEDPTTKNDEQLENLGDCFGCWESLANSVYFSLDCGFNLHKKCTELPLEINHMCHRKHPLLLQFNAKQFNDKRPSCKICQHTQRRGFVYCCSLCEFVVRIQCLSASPSPIIEDKGHPHPFTLFWRRAPFICDACGTEGNGVAYLCDCKIVAHVNCATKDTDWYYVVEEEDEDEKSIDSLELCPITIIETAYYPSRLHISVVQNQNVISFFTKSVLNYPRGNRFGFMNAKNNSSALFQSTFSDVKFVSTCPMALATNARNARNTFALNVRWAYYCKDCKFALGPECLTLPTRVQHKCDEKHLLALTYHDHNDYSATHYCDICEETRDPSQWFYRCATCDTSAHVDCVLGDKPFIRLGSICKLEEEEDQDHEHPPTFVKKIYYYPECIKCGERCHDLAVECGEHECNYIAHWRCIKPLFYGSSFGFLGKLLGLLGGPDS
ncbi:Zinc finger, PHD-type [Corchorus olitorius]|uniref:Zinc finger, PHD-type n=1 Tax=Corchorus olitorius TaxID=93759 RepID=A0A1R3IAN4_9ROSI|nr:Zinc finger, PHD-type [Corchorus olitorius]